MYKLSDIPLYANSKEEAVQAKRLLIEICNTYQVSASTIITLHKTAFENEAVIKSILADLKSGTNLGIVLAKNAGKLQKIFKK